MAIEHKDIPEADLHEAKGVSTASAGSTYVTDGLGSGVWERQGYGCSSLTGDGTAQTTTSATFQEVNATNFPAGTTTWANNQAANGITFDTTSGYYTVADAGTYLINYAFCFSSDDASTCEFQMTIGIDTGSGVVSKEANTTAYRGTTAAGIVGHMAGTCVPTLTSGAKVYIMVRRNSGTGDIQIKSGNFVIHRVG